MTNKVVVLGSLNVDRILQMDRVPEPGETLALNNQDMAGGGKGANQAIAAARSGAQTSFIGRVGADENGKFMLQQLVNSGVTTDLVAVDEDAGTGQAFVMVEKSGENRILIYGGANAQLSATDVKKAQTQIAAADLMVAQLETPVETTQFAFQMAKELGVKTILNPAPAVAKLPAELLKNTDVITPNETEVEILTGIAVTDEAAMLKAAQRLHDLGVATVIITLGSKGVFYDDGVQHGIVPAFKVWAVDTTAAGDTFLGALSSELNPDLSNLKTAIEYGNKASSLAVQKMGAQPSIPTRKDILK
ncbi:ribokinase [Pediococcus acidilactici]|jgi:ribokinase|uniref:ribokinase n=1 Tax=Pediococcus acidilactici TaxID=1254 RepID=UPI0006B4B2DD|nr:ribokinase [Pediococcus acidilactici]KAF0371174.1 ribokinase [Pediococcus acidilactici]KAF0382425.1 ribokinase [Pediococcus acidilactici]KAF0455943.1 ribokinase [Pediococcus acidilactici]KAF0475746.1 ribokinase [Pediococcus acidilactici]KAF0535854.1 ribokinase [Pediococcus acidilactici]